MFHAIATHCQTCSVNLICSFQAVQVKWWPQRAKDVFSALPSNICNPRLAQRFIPHYALDILPAPLSPQHAQNFTLMESLCASCESDEKCGYGKAVSSPYIALRQSKFKSSQSLRRIRCLGAVTY